MELGRRVHARTRDLRQPAAAGDANGGAKFRFIKAQGKKERREACDRLLHSIKLALEAVRLALYLIGQPCLPARATWSAEQGDVTRYK